MNDTRKFTGHCMGNLPGDYARLPNHAELAYQAIRQLLAGAHAYTVFGAWDPMIKLLCDAYMAADQPNGADPARAAGAADAHHGTAALLRAYTALVIADGSLALLMTTEAATPTSRKWCAGSGAHVPSPSGVNMRAAPIRICLSRRVKRLVKMPHIIPVPGWPGSGPAAPETPPPPTANAPGAPRP